MSATGTGLLWPALSREVEIKCVLAGSWQQQLFTSHSLGLRYGGFVLGAALPFQGLCLAAERFFPLPSNTPDLLRVQAACAVSA